ncbi:type II toxin-antitoxin system RelE/ParE family toxin (plasmid) [Sphingomonas paeninsulae]|uniref:Type II toxin-antitoxin system RelE/ParE family toxin n=1 Tax=Sphingomonas paeninsulae TaxID=2319844 RepID=A0A494TB90_SPHPE|nr:type II toxin-antitoxin system RelE/ParE family toxin [Sphingomonas paeninsulae]AYJ84702.1 type II toxin-antitoxin system RelE/ParE family toxin [Sphingomonas paeninsulae]
MKKISFLGDSLDRLRDFPEAARSEAGHQLNEVQNGNNPDDWKPMKSIGTGVREIRIREDSGAFRVIYLATLPEAVLVLHAFQKKTQATSQRDIELAASRLRAWKA